MEKYGYIEKFKNISENVKVHDNSPNGKIVQDILDILCRNNLSAFEGVAILEQCALEVICGSKIIRKSEIQQPDDLSTEYIPTSAEKDYVGILSANYQKLVVLNAKTNEELAVINDADKETPIDTANENIVVKLTPYYSEAQKNNRNFELNSGLTLNFESGKRVSFPDLEKGIKYLEEITDKITKNLPRIHSYDQ